MKKTMATTLTAIIVTAAISIACFAGCAKKSEPVKQYASAYLAAEDGNITATVDLSDGYSCEFATGAVYLYDKDANNAAIGITLEQDLYEDYISRSQKASDRKELNGGIMFSEDDQMIYICDAGDSAHFAILADGVNASQMESIAARFTVEDGI